MAERPDDIVGHKTFDTGEICPDTSFPKMRHEPLTRAEADALWEAAEKAKAERTARMPDEQSAIRAMFDAWQRLKELGWNDPMYCPKDGSHFQVIEPGSTGIHDGNYMGEWPKGAWWVYDGDVWPSHPVLFKLYPEDQAKEDERRAAARAKFAAEEARAVVAESNGHHWIKFGRMIYCRDCGFIRRADDKNKPCRGVVNVGLRDPALTNGQHGEGDGSKSLKQGGDHV
jgi:hypothetical protein